MPSYKVTLSFRILAWGRPTLQFLLFYSVPGRAPYITHVWERGEEARHYHFYDKGPAPKVGQGATKHNISVLPGVPKNKIQQLAILGASF